MDKYACPHCEKPGISSIRKSFLGIAASTSCKSCGQKVGVPYWSIVTIIPMLIALLVVPKFFTEPESVSVVAVLLTALTFELNTLVPLIKK